MSLEASNTLLAFASYAKRFRGIRARLTLLYLAIFGSMLILFCSVLFQNFQSAQQNQFDIALYNHGIDISQKINLDAFGNIAMDPDLFSTGGKIFPFAAGNVFIELRTLNGIEIGRSSNLGKSQLPFSKESLSLLIRSQAVFQTLTSAELKLPISSGNPKYRMLTALSPGKLTQNFILQVAVPDTFLTEMIEDLKRFFWLAIPSTLIMATFAGLYLSRKALAPVSAIIEKANQLSPSRLSDRIPIPPADDEIRKLALTLNELLERLERAFSSQERFIADASHELKTPLAILQGELDVFRNRSRTQQEVEDFLKSAKQEIIHLSKLVQDLLILARVDAGAEVISKAHVRLDELVLDVISKIEPLAHKKGLKIRFLIPENQVDVSTVVDADADLLSVLVKNLVENAVKYAPPNTLVSVNLGLEQEEIVLQVTDTGPGIPKEIIPKIFERFYRASSDANAGTREPDSVVPTGAGLGLAIAKRIAEVHGGRLEVYSTPHEKTTFSFKIKRLNS